MPRLGLNDTHIATAVGCSVWTVWKWRRRSLRQGRVGLAKPMGRPATGPMSTFPHELQEAILHLQAPSWLLTSHPVSCSEARIPIGEISLCRAEHASRPCSNMLAWPDTPRSSPSRLDPTASSSTEQSTSGMADGCGIRIMRVDGVGLVSLLSFVDVMSRLKVESSPGMETTKPGLPDYHLTDAPGRLPSGLPETVTASPRYRLL
jgi:hypothetical protein